MIMRSLIIILLLATTYVSAYSQPYQFRGEYRDGIYPDKNLADHWPEQGLPVMATIEGIGDGFGSPSFNERGIYIAGMIRNKGYLFHFDTRHQLIWKFEYGKEFDYKYIGSRGTPTLDGDRLYYSGTYGNAVCLDNGTGEVIWKNDIFETFKGDTVKWGYTESPLVYQDLVILTPGGPGHNVVALDKMTGELRWALDKEGTGNAYNSPVLFKHQGTDYIVMNTTNSILFLRPLSGQIAYSHSLTHDRIMHAISPIYLDDKIFYSSGYGEGSVLLGINETTRGMDTIFTNPDLDTRLSGLIASHGIAYGTSDRKKQWVGVDLNSGETVFTSREIKPGSFLEADNKFYIFTETGEVVLAVPGEDGFTVASKFTIPVQPASYAFAHPVLYKGILHIRYNDNLWLYNVGKE